MRDELKGMDAVLEALNVDPEQGISLLSLDEREAAFGTHYKPPPERTPFFRILLNALDDLMLKILIACAIANIIVGYSVPE
jgi:magnesium-transporting ATPase (P-type)